MRSGTLVFAALLALPIAGCGGGGSSSSAQVPVDRGTPVPVPSFASFAIPTAPDTPPAGYSVAVAIDGTVGFAGSTHGTFARGAFSGITTGGGLGDGTLLYGRGADGTLFTAGIQRLNMGLPFVRQPTTSTSWAIPQPACSRPAGSSCDPTNFPFAVLAGSDRATWVLTTIAMVRLNADRTTSLVPLPATAGPPQPRDAAVGSDGAFWITEPVLGTIDRVAPDGSSVSFAAGGHPTRITSGSDGALYFLDTAGRIGRITTSGSVTTLVAAVRGGISDADGIAAGGDGALWFTQANANVLARASTAGDVTAYTVPGAGATPDGIAAASDGSLWLVEGAGPVLVHVTPPASASSVTVRF